MPEQEKLSKNSKSMFKAMEMALKPTEKLLQKQKVLLTHLTRNSYKSAEDKLESGKAEKLKVAEEEKQTGFLAGLFGKSDKKEKSGGIWGFLKNNWGKIAILIGLLLTPIKHLVAGFEWIQGYFKEHTWAEIGTDIAKAFVLGLGLKIGAGILFKELSKVFLKALLPEGAALTGVTGGSLASALLPAASILAFVAGIGKSIWDGVEGWNFAKEWGVDGIDGAIGGFIGGTGKGLTGALTNALSKGGIGIGVGFAVGGPIGAIVGGIVGAAFGAITGWFGGERIAKWVNESRKAISKEWENVWLAIDNVADSIIRGLRAVLPEEWGKNLKTKSEREEAARRGAVGGDMSNLSVQQQNQIQKEEHTKEDKSLRGGAASAVAKGDLKGIEAEIESIYADMDAANLTKENFAGERKQKLIPLKKRLDKLKGDADAIYEAREAQKATKMSGTSKSGIQQLKDDEGFRSKVYDDTEGIKTIGFGFNLEREGTQKALDSAGIKKSVADLKSGKVNLTEKEAERLMMGEYPYFRQAAKRYLGEDKWPPFPESKKDALTNMAYNLGEKSLNTFTNLREALRNEDYELAGQEVLKSKYATQVGDRAHRISGALSASVPPMDKSNAFNAQQNMNNELKGSGTGGSQTIVIDKSQNNTSGGNTTTMAVSPSATDGKQILNKT